MECEPCNGTLQSQASRSPQWPSLWNWRWTVKRKTGKGIEKFDRIDAWPLRCPRWFSLWRRRRQRWRQPPPNPCPCHKPSIWVTWCRRRTAPSPGCPAPTGLLCSWGCPLRPHRWAPCAGRAPWRPPPGSTCWTPRSSPTSAHSRRTWRTRPRGGAGAWLCARVGGRRRSIVFQTPSEIPNAPPQPRPTTCPPPPRKAPSPCFQLFLWHF